MHLLVCVHDIPREGYPGSPKYCLPPEIGTGWWRGEVGDRGDTDFSACTILNLLSLSHENILSIQINGYTDASIDIDRKSMSK